MNGIGIILVGRIAEKAVLQLVSDNIDTLNKEYPGSYLRRGIAGLQCEFTDNEAGKMITAASFEGLSMVGEDGIFAALWRMGEEIDSGLRVELSKISISQFCIEISDRFDINPYTADSTGCVLILCKDPLKLNRELTEGGAHSAIIGYLTDDKTRGIMNNGIISYLNRPGK